MLHVHGLVGLLSPWKRLPRLQQQGDSKISEQGMPLFLLLCVHVNVFVDFGSIGPQPILSGTVPGQVSVTSVVMNRGLV